MELHAESHLFVVVGGKGDLMHRKLLPALYRLRLRGDLPAGVRILGAARAAGDDYTYRQWGRESLSEAGYSDEAALRWCEESLFYQSVGGEDPYADLAGRVTAIEAACGLPGNRVFYLAMPPGAFPGAITGLGEAGLSQGPGWTRLVIEKPFGHDLASARELNQLVHRYFEERQVYRIDHYLGKETVQNLLVFRFANPLFEHMWDRDRVERVEITVAESLGLEGRAGYYDKAGALRDMIQNHLTQLLTLTAMEVPAAFEADAIRDEKVKVLRSIAPIRPENAVFGQYTAGTAGGREVPGYLEEPGVAPGSRTETFVALKLELHNWRWQGVPFYLRTGKNLPQKNSQIVVTFRRPPVVFFRSQATAQPRPNQLTITLQPDEGFTLSFEVKSPGEALGLETQKLRFRYDDVHPHLPDAYDTLLLDVMRGDATLFVRADEVEASWQLYTPLLEQMVPVYPYPAGSWGPREANELLEGEERVWATR